MARTAEKTVSGAYRIGLNATLSVSSLLCASRVYSELIVGIASHGA